jgi:hypothetical protein
MNVRSALFAALLVLAAALPVAAADAFVVHGIPGVAVDVYATAAGAPIPGSPTISNFQPKAVRSITAGPGAVDIRIFAAGANPQTATPVIAVLGVSLPASGEVSIVAHLTEGGQPTATIYRNDSSIVQSGWARVSVRHTAAAPAVQLVAGGVPKLALSNPYFGDLEVPAVPIALQLQTPFAAVAITPVVTLPFASGTRYFVYAIGSLNGGSFDFIVHATR